MSRRTVIIWCGAALGAAVLCCFYPPFRVESIDDAADASPYPANLAVPGSVADRVDEFWTDRLRDAFDDAVDIEQLFEAVDRDAGQARSKYGRQVGLGGASFFFVRGAGRVEEVAADYCTLKIGERSRRARVRIGVVMGNAVRDSTGLFDVNQFANSQDFNNVSAELNRRVEADVIAPSRERLQVGTRVRFVGCAQASDDRDFDPLSLVPVHLDIEDPEARPCTAPDPGRHPVLEARAVLKRFPGVLALDRVDLQIHAGEVHGLIGENGAGKSTLMHVLAGAQQPDDGQILLDGRRVKFANAREALDRRISIVYQDLNLVPHLTVAENVFLGRELRSATGLIASNEQNRRCAGLLEPLDPTIDPRAEANSLRVGQQQIVEVAKALNAQARVIFMDEPTSAISDQEIEVLFGLIESLKQDGIAIVYVSHKLDELLRISDRVTVLRDGRLVKTLSVKDTGHSEIVRLMVGRELSEMFVHTSAEPRGERLRVSRLSRESDAVSCPRVDGVSFAVDAGEILGVFGLMGAGRTELLESIFGLWPRQASGEVYVDGKRRAIRSPGSAMRHGIGLVPEDRKRDGLVSQMSVEQNISLSCLVRMARGGLLSRDAERDHADEYVGRFTIRTPSVQETVRNLSGGNQQKVVLARVLSCQPRVLLLDEPTRGIDVGAKREIYTLIDDLKRQGLAIVVVSSELPELLGIADRIMVMCEGRKTAQFSRSEATEEAVMRAAVPGALEHA